MSADLLKLPSEEVDIPFSILDTDLYKLSMQNAVLRHFPDAQVVIRFTNRNPSQLFSRECFEWIQQHVNSKSGPGSDVPRLINAGLSTLSLTASERTALHKACPYFPQSYLDWLAEVRLNPKDEVQLEFLPRSEDGGQGEISCVIKGFWRTCILYEVPIMSIMSEGYFKFVDTDWNNDGQQENAKKKALQMLNPGPGISSLAFSEFGTRRRRSFHSQDLVLRGLIEGYEEWKAAGGIGGALSGTSNVYLALKYGLTPIGTIAHEWIMAIGAMYGYKGANGRAMDMWEEVYPRGANQAPLTMLTDTFTADAFFVDFRADPERALRWPVLRQDSGDPFWFVGEAKRQWAEVERLAGIQSTDGQVAKGKRVVFSDGLDVQRAIELQKLCDELGIGASFGIGTSLTNDFRKASNGGETSKPLNIVIKLSQIDGRDCVKLSDDKGKYTGEPEEVKRVQRELGLDAEPLERRRG